MIYRTGFFFFGLSMFLVREFWLKIGIRLWSKLW